MRERKRSSAKLLFAACSRMAELSIDGRLLWFANLHLCSGMAQEGYYSALMKVLMCPHLPLNKHLLPGLLACSAADMPTQLEVAMDAIIRTFHRYSCREGDRFKLNKGELKLLLQRELTEFFSVSLLF
jgi:hypothetical protein